MAAMSSCSYFELYLYKFAFANDAVVALLTEILSSKAKMFSLDFSELLLMLLDKRAACEYLIYLPIDI